MGRCADRRARGPTKEGGVEVENPVNGHPFCRRPLLHENATGNARDTYFVLIRSVVASVRPCLPLICSPPPSVAVVILRWRGAREMGQSGRVRERASFVRCGGGLAQFGHIIQGVSPSSCVGRLRVCLRRISSGVKVGLGATTTPIPFSRK